jgi:hypothetical protein
MEQLKPSMIITRDSNVSPRSLVTMAEEASAPDPSPTSNRYDFGPARFFSIVGFPRGLVGMLLSSAAHHY